jgi:hypothetical protein
LILQYNLSKNILPEKHKTSYVFYGKDKEKGLDAVSEGLTTGNTEVI